MVVGKSPFLQSPYSKTGGQFFVNTYELDGSL